MKISRLEIFGFKSFLERVVLPVDAGITAIVGPNGCGKSNIVDALRWVFGETRASQLRGSLLEDVIFNGTETLRPLGLAEVSLVISTDKASLYDDILNSKLVSESVFKKEQEQIESAIDEQAKEVQESDETAEKNNRPKLVVIEGALSNKNDEQGDSDKEEADVLKDQEQVVTSDQEDVDQQPEEQIQLEQTEIAPSPQIQESSDPALDRFAWLKLSREVEVTRRLYRSGESEFFINKVACRLRDLKDLFRLLGLGARSYTLVAQGEVSRIITSKPEERRLMIEEAAGVSGVRERLAAAEKRLEDTKLSLVRLHDLLAEVTRQVNSLRVQATRARSRAELKERLKFLELSVFGDKLRHFTERNESIEIEVNLLKEREEHAKSELDNLLGTEESIQKQLVELNSTRDTLSQKLRCGRVELEARRAQRGALEAEIQSIEHELKARAPQMEEFNQRLSAVSQQLLNAEEELSEFTSAITNNQEKINSLEKSCSVELEQAITALEQGRSELSQIQTISMDIKVKCQALEAKVGALDEQLNLLGQSDKLEALEENVKEKIKSLAPLLSKVHAEDQYRKALEVAVSQYSDLQVGTNLLELAESFISKGGSTTFNLRAVDAGSVVSLNHTSRSDLPKLISMLNFEDGYQNLFEQLLGNVYLSNSMEEAVKLVKEDISSNENSNNIYVTLAGELVSSNEFSLYGDSAGPVQKFARRKEILDQLESTKEELLKQDELLARQKQNVELLEGQHATALQASVDSEQEIRRLTTDLGALRGKAEVVSRLVTQLLKDKENITFSLSGWDSEKHSLVTRHEDLKSMLEIGDGQEGSSLDQETLDQIEAQLDEVNSNGKDLIDSLEQRSKARDHARSEFEGLTALRSRAEFELEKLVLEKDAVNSRLHDLYPEISLDEVLASLAINEDEKQSYTEEADKLRLRIQREGEVDPESIVLFEKEQQRLDELKAQKADLETAEKALAETVLQLSDLAKRRFLETFKIVQANFARLIPKVFGGGFGALQLENMDDPFEGGVEVSVRPPGKKPKSIELLSGGERALCAIAMIFSMFLHRPSPLCVLDEVDAPLDEANLRRYLMMVREMSSVTQFLMISHNKESMGAADRLVGVTQMQPGASQIVTVSLEQAQAQVA